MSSSYLGITAHFYSTKDHRRHSVTLAMRRMPQTHTGNNIHEIVESVLKEWDNPSSKISATLTDNGSNTIAAIRPQILEVENDDNTEETRTQKRVILSNCRGNSRRKSQSMILRLLD